MRWLARLLVAFGAVLLVPLLGSAAWAAEGARQEVETTCTGGTVATNASASNGQIRVPGTVVCPVASSSTGTTVARLYGFAAEGRQVTVTVTGSDPQPAVTSPVATGGWGTLLWSSQPIPAGASVSLTIVAAPGPSGINGPLLDWTTADVTAAPSPSPSPSPAASTAPASPSPSPSSSPATSSPSPVSSPSASSPPTASASGCGSSPASPCVVTLDGDSLLALGVPLVAVVLTSAVSVSLLMRP